MASLAIEDPVEREMTKEETRIRMEKCLARLPLVHRAVMKLWLEEAKPAEIAVRIHLNVEMVYRCLESAKCSIRRDWPDAPFPQVAS